MREAHPIERAVGMAYYVSDAEGVGGRLRATPEDFRVRELERFDPEPLDADPGAYPHLLVRATLRDWDTNDFAAELSNRLGISRERVSWAGTKDKRAVTTQLLTVSKVDADELPVIDEAQLEPLGRTGRAIEFGDLAGNDFEVVVRDPEEPEGAEEIATQLREFGGGQAGVPNYFGQQRFGSKRPVTHEVGRAIVQEDWEQAVLTYVGNPHEREGERTREARAYVEETRDWQGALDRLPGYLNYERAMCHALVEDPEDFRGAVETLPWNLQRLMVNGFQSYLFNRMLSARLERGLPFDDPVAGDVVCFSDSDAPEAVALPDTDRLQAVTEARLDTVRRHCERGRAFVTAPLVGTETDLGDGEPGDIERAVLEEEGVEPSDFDLPGDFHSTGTRRAILVRTDLDVTQDPLTFSFALPKGSYATVVLREFRKGDPDA